DAEAERVVPHADGGPVVARGVVRVDGDGALREIPAVLAPARALLLRHAGVVAGPEVEPRRAPPGAVVVRRARDQRLDQPLLFMPRGSIVAPLVEIVDA